MDIKIMTCHDVYNAGASLQAFALQTFLENNGHDVELIDYKPPYIDFPYKLSLFVHPDSPVKKYADRSAVVKLLYALKRYLFYLPYSQRKKAFDEFTRSFLNLTHQYKSDEELLRDVPEADTYIVGSDQVWNSTTMLNGKDPAFFLNFVPEGKRKISYAASFGADDVNDDVRDNIRAYLSSFDAISVRESSGVDIVRRLGFGCTHVCDPVFLLSEEEWREALDIVNGDTEPYVLIYNLTSVNSRLLQDAQYVASAKGLKSYSISPMKVPGVDGNFVNIGPKEFVRMIFNAEYVFTNSFHATAFSMISRKQFCTYNYHSVSNSSRMYSLLNESGMLDCLNVRNVYDALVNPTDYSQKSERVSSFADKGKCWLLNNI